MLSEEDVGGSALSQILDTAHDRAATKAQLLSKNRPSSQPNPSVIKRNPRISKQDQKQMQSHHQPQDASFPPLPIPARLRSGSSENPSIKINPRGGASWRSSRENSGDNDYDVGLSLDEDQPRPLRKSPVAKLTVADQIQLSKRIQAQEMEAAVNNMVCCNK